MIFFYWGTIPCFKILLCVHPPYLTVLNIWDAVLGLRTFARKTSATQIFFIAWLRLDNELPMSERQNNWRVTDFVFEIKRVENYPNFDTSVRVTRHGLSAC